MIPSSRPILPPVAAAAAPPVGEIPAVPRHSQPHSLLTQMHSSTLRYFLSQHLGPSLAVRGKGSNLSG